MKKKQKYVIKTDLVATDVDYEDGGCAKIFTASDNSEENGIFVRIQSWDDNKKHKDFDKFIGRKIKITIKTID